MREPRREYVVLDVKSAPVNSSNRTSWRVGANQSPVLSDKDVESIVSLSVSNPGKHTSSATGLAINSPHPQRSVLRLNNHPTGAPATPARNTDHGTHHANECTIVSPFTSRFVQPARHNSRNAFTTCCQRQCFTAPPCFRGTDWLNGASERRGA